MSGWILVGCCGGLVGIGLYLLATAPPVRVRNPHNYFLLRDCPTDCPECDR